MKAQDLARLENLKCGHDITRFNDEFNKIGQGCRDILPEEAQKFRYIRLVKPEGLRKFLQSACAQSSLQQLQSLAVQMQDLHAPAPTPTWREQTRGNFPNSGFNRDGGRRSLCKKCNSWHGEKERCRTSTPDRPRTDQSNTRKFDPRNKPGPRVTEAELEREEFEDTAVEEVD
jgi:hypothetical protein